MAHLILRETRSAHVCDARRDLLTTLPLKAVSYQLKSHYSGCAIARIHIEGSSRNALTLLLQFFKFSYLSAQTSLAETDM